MTQDERKILEDAENQAFETSQQLNESLSSGRRPEPQIESTESTLEGQTFGLDLGGDSLGAQTDNTPGGSARPPPHTGPTGACCVPGFGCLILDAASCAFVFGTYMGDGTDCTPDPC